ncbi:MAG: metal-dependent transcriptional regulator [Sedimentisphaerales bacterium]|nr:metal-dependent transcriptional regulator [Sedimentisphaerales bacterium]
MSAKAIGQLSASLEDYLEAIFWMVAAHGAARARDIARKLKVKASSVTTALQALAEKKYINYTPYEAITLTREGFNEAARVARQHHILRSCFVELLGIDDATAEQGACRVEHNMPPVIVERIAQFHEFIKTLPEKHRRFVMRFVEACREKTAAGNVGVSRTTVADMKVGRQGVIMALKREGAVSRRLADMGIGRGVLIEVVGIAPMSGPIRVKIRGYSLALRKSEAQGIVVLER